MSLWCENCEERGEWFEHSNDVLVAERDALAARLAESDDRAARLAVWLEESEARLAEAAVKVNNVAECLAYGMDVDECINEIRLVAASMGYRAAVSASGGA